MIVYSAQKSTFLRDVHRNRIHHLIIQEFHRRLSHSVSESEINSWRNSLQHMSQILRDPDIPDDAGVNIEYHIPLTSKRIDFILTGRNGEQRETAVIVELKQWSKATTTPKDGIISTFLGGGERETSHPSYQAWTYAALIEDYNETVRHEHIALAPCAYLHNMDIGNAVNDPCYKPHTDRAPVFISRDVERFTDFLKQHVKYGDDRQIMYRIEHGKIRPSRNLADSLVSMLKGNRDFLMIDDQKLVYETALEQMYLAQQGQKQVLIVEGGPGTGKSVVAINLLVEMTDREKVVQYVSRNAAPREVYHSKLTGSMTQSRIKNLFKGSGAFTETEPDTFDALLVDEAHRLNEKSGFYGNQGDHQIREIIKAARLSVFFIDEDQRVTLKDIGDRATIRQFAEQCGAHVKELALQSQFRCNGSDGFLAFVDHALQIRETANTDAGELDYDIRVVDSPFTLKEKILEKNATSNRARMVAGYCWDWKSKKDPKEQDIDIPEHGFFAQWNLTDDGSLWIIAENSVNQIGCIHTCQGLELDYVGVIIGPDLIVRDGRIITDAGKRSSMDRSIRGYKKWLKEDPEAARRRADAIIRNTYRTLMTRGQKGCYLYCTDRETSEYFKALLARPEEQPDPEERYPGLTLPVLAPEEVTPGDNSVPVYDLHAAAGAFSDEQTIEENEQENPLDHVVLPDVFTARPGHFVARLVGQSMNRRIPDGAWCLFSANPAGTREGKIVLVGHRDIQDPDTGGRFTVKRYHSEKTVHDDGTWEHSRIVLRPESNTAGYEDIQLNAEAGAELRVYGELVVVLG
ncbi:MAG: DNA/RNA helicase domain-containing protein [Pseudohongiellaceae bacterium]